ncbi:MAG: PHP domain-containing protein [Lachnospiraceae bacterium]|nr:PHP domain-containing protein [Lachnospiraceae bacterium]
MKLDMHCHTKEGSPDGKIPLLEHIELLQKKGYQGMLITDHNSYKAYRYYKTLTNKPSNFTVLCGIEYDTLDAGHILIIMPSGIRPRLLEHRGLPIFLLIEIVHLYGGILGPAHPCGEKFLSIFHTRFGKTFLEKLVKHFDFMETYNACEDDISNDLSAALARKYRLPGIGGSDSHRRNCVGLGYTIIQQHIQNENDFIQYITSGLPVKAGGKHYHHTTKQKLGKANHVLVYSFWFYNKFLALFHTKARNLELQRQKDE